jgi:hypothetical protein
MAAQGLSTQRRPSLGHVPVFAAVVSTAANVSNNRVLPQEGAEDGASSLPVLDLRTFNIICTFQRQYRARLQSRRFKQFAYLQWVRKCQFDGVAVARVAVLAGREVSARGFGTLLRELW